MKKLLLALVLACPIWATVSTEAVFEVRQAGSNNNPGCFVEGATGTDFSQQNSAQYTFTDLVIDASTAAKITSASHNFVAADVGNCLRITAGSGFSTGVYEILSVASNAATLDRNAGSTSSTGGTFFVGGALATWAQLNTDMCSDCRAWIKADADYTTSSAVSFNYSVSARSWIAGYTSVRGDGGSATLKATSGFGGWMIQMSIGGKNFTLKNVILDLNGQTGTGCVLFNSHQTYIEKMECKNSAGPGSALVLFNNVRSQCLYCYFHDNTYSGTIGTVFWNNDANVCAYCTIKGSSDSGFIGFYMTRGRCESCVVYNATGANADAFLFSNQGEIAVDHAVVYNVTRNAFNIAAVAQPLEILNAIIEHVTNGINNTSGTNLRAGDMLSDYNFIFDASGSNYLNTVAGAHSQALSRSAFVNASGADFRPNNNRGGGFEVRGKGAPRTIPGFAAGTYPDAGVYQHQDPKFGFLF